MTEGVVSDLYAQLTNGSISRRQFIERAALTGIGTGCGPLPCQCQRGLAAGGSKNGFAVYPGQDGTPAPSPTGAGKARIRDRGPDPRRGRRAPIIQWQAATMANAHASVGTKDFLVCVVVQEPLMNYLPDGTIIPRLVTEVPAVENGLLAEDLRR